MRATLAAGSTTTRSVSGRVRTRWVSNQAVPPGLPPHVATWKLTRALGISPPASSPARRFCSGVRDAVRRSSWQPGKARRRASSTVTKTFASAGWTARARRRRAPPIVPIVLNFPPRERTIRPLEHVADADVELIDARSGAVLPILVIHLHDDLGDWLVVDADGQDLDVVLRVALEARGDAVLRVEGLVAGERDERLLAVRPEGEEIVAGLDVTAGDPIGDRGVAREIEGAVEGRGVSDLRLDAEGAQLEAPALPFDVPFEQADVRIRTFEALARLAEVGGAAGQEPRRARVVEAPDPAEIPGVGVGRSLPPFAQPLGGE